jgi:hypothetical protein
MMHKRLGLALAFLSLFVAPLPAVGDEIRIVRGTVFQPLSFFGDLNIQGTSGLRIDATLGGSSGSFWSFCDIVACLPGDEIDIGIEYNFLDVFGQVAIQGQTYTLTDGAFLQLRFDGTTVLPEFTDTDIVEVTAPFTFSGSLQVPDRHEPGTSDVFELQGSGVATITLEPNQFFTGWVVGSVTYDFVSRPE